MKIATFKRPPWWILLLLPALAPGWSCTETTPGDLPGDEDRPAEVEEVVEVEVEIEEAPSRCVFPDSLLPEPTGKYCVGTTTPFHLVDNSRLEAFTEDDPEDVRELIVQLWYPVDPGGQGAPAPYMDRITAETIMPPISAELEDWHEQVLAHALLEAQPAADVARFPVLLYASGWGGVYQAQAALLEDLAGHGYVIAAINHPYISGVVIFPDGRVVENPVAVLQAEMDYLEEVFPTAVEDVRFVLDWLESLERADPRGRWTGRLDLTSVGMFGHSYGGATAFDVCRADPRLVAAINMDGTLFGPVAARGTNCPVMYMLGKGSLSPMPWALFGGDAYGVSVEDSDHTSFLDLALLVPRIAPSLPQSFLELLQFGAVDPVHMQQITRAYHLAFFDSYLRGQPLKRLTDLAARYEDVLFRSHLDP